MLGQPLNSVEGTEFVLATLPATQCDHQGQKPSVIDHDRSIRIEEGVGMCASDSNSLSSLQSTMARLIPCKQNSWPGQVKISKNIINVGEKYHPHMAINTPHMAIFNEQSHYYTRVSGGLLQFSLGKGFLTIPSCHLLLAELGNSARSRRGSRSEARPSKRCAGSPRQIWARKG